MIPTRVLGHSGIEVGQLALGVMMFGHWGNTDVAECHRMVHRALDAGVTLVDTADMYDTGVSETILGEGLRGRRDSVVLATKVGNPMGGDLSRSGLSRRWIDQACDDSLRRLQVDHIDLYQMHRPDPSTPMEETLEAFDRLVASGKVRAIGTSTFSPAQLEELHAPLAGDRGWARPTSEQPPYSALARGIETEVLPLLRRLDVGAIVWAPLNGGWLTGKYQQPISDDQSRALRQPDHFDHRDEAMRTKREIVAQLIAIAADAGMSLPQLALAFVLDDRAVSAAIVGPRTDAQLAELLALGDLTLPPGVRERIDAVVTPGRNVNPADAG